MSFSKKKLEFLKAKKERLLTELSKHQREKATGRIANIEWLLDDLEDEIEMARANCRG